MKEFLGVCAFILILSSIFTHQPAFTMGTLIGCILAGAVISILTNK